MRPDTHSRERDRLRALRSYRVLDTGPEPLFDELVALATELFDVPIALVCLVDEHRQWFKARVGVAATQTSLDMSLCAHAILDDGMLVIEDTKADGRFDDHPLIGDSSLAGEPIRFYAGALLDIGDGLPLGTLCVLDHRPRTFDARQRHRLGLLRDQVMALLDRHRLQAESERRTRLKSDFLAHISHEIRTPLASILGYAELLGGTLQGADELEIVRTILRNGGYLQSIVDEVLDISRIEAGQLEVHHAPCALDLLLRDIDALMRLRAAENGIGWRVECLDALPLEIRTDPMRLRQILINLAGNAVKFTTEGEVVLAVTQLSAPDRPRPDGTVQIEFAVRDTGIGMSTEQLDRVFVPFGQAESDTAARFGGSGLGLAISHELARMLDGELLVESEPGTGSVFRLRIACEPLGTARAVPSVIVGPDARDVPAAPADVTALSGRQLLVVDDREDIRHLVERTLERAGAKVVAVSGGARALELLHRGVRREARQFDALVLDMQMPGLDGFGVLAAMRESTIAVPVIALSAGALTGQHERCLAAGCNAFVSKPFGADELIGAIRLLFPADEAADGPAEASTMSRTVRAATRLLIVDDSRDLTDALRRLLIRHGYTVETANSAGAALALTARGAPDCILLDRHLPDMDSPELITVLRSREHLLDTRYVSLSGSVIGDADRARLGCDLYLHKPVAMKVLLEALDGLLGRTSG